MALMTSLFFLRRFFSPTIAVGGGPEHATPLLAHVVHTASSTVLSQEQETFMLLHSRQDRGAMLTFLGLAEGEWLEECMEGRRAAGRRRFEVSKRARACIH